MTGLQRTFRQWLRPLAWLTAGLAMPAAGEPVSVMIDLLAIGNTDSYQLFRQRIEATRSDYRHNLRVLDALPATLDGTASPRLLVVLGNRGFASLGPLPTGYDAVLAVHVDAATFRQQQARWPTDGPPLTALFSGAPMQRQWRLAQLTLPTAVRWTVPHAPGTEPLLEPLLASAAGGRARLLPQPLPASGNPVPALQPALRDSDGILALDDLQAITPDSVRSILLTSYRQGRPVVGMDAAYVRAGVLASTYSSVDHYAAAAERIVRDWLATGQLPPPAHPAGFAVLINRQVAQSLDLTLPDEKTLADTLRQQEATP